jgi:hypothetical protein
VEKLSFDGIHDHTKIQVGEDGPEFIIKGNINKKNLSGILINHLILYKAKKASRGP